MNYDVLGETMHIVGKKKSVIKQKNKEAGVSVARLVYGLIQFFQD